MGLGMDGIFQNSQNTLFNGTVTSAPFVEAFAATTAQQMAGRLPGGANYHGNSAANNGNIMLIDPIETSAASLNYPKNVWMNLTLNATANSTISLFALTANATTVGANAVSLVTDNGFTSMNAWNAIIIRNLAGSDGSACGTATLTVNVGAANGANLPIAVNNAFTVQPSSAAFFESTGNGQTINATKTNITFAGNGQNVSVCIMGS